MSVYGIMHKHLHDGVYYSNRAEDFYQRGHRPACAVPAGERKLWIATLKTAKVQFIRTAEDGKKTYPIVEMAFYRRLREWEFGREHPDPR